MRGGPKLTGELPEQIPAMCDVVLRVVHEPQRRPWPMAYKCNPDPSWVMKDRFDVATKCDPAPMNLAELLRARGVHMPRRPEHEKMEDRVDKLASFFLGKTPDTWLDSAQAAAKQLLDAGVPSNEVRWTLRDAMDRAVIRGALAASETNFLGRVH